MIRAYKALENIHAPQSRAIVNKEYGAGEGIQMYIRNYQRRLEAIRDIKLSYE